jgi:transcriptional regulator with XRE-family HTH domain
MQFDKVPPFLRKAIEEGAESLANSLRTARKRRGFTLTDMAQKIGVTPRTLIRLEKGDSKVNVATLLACLSVYGLLDQLAASVGPERDLRGMERERLRLPERVRKKRKSQDKYDLNKL